MAEVEEEILHHQPCVRKGDGKRHQDTDKEDRASTSVAGGEHLAVLLRGAGHALCVVELGLPPWPPGPPSRGFPARVGRDAFLAVCADGTRRWLERDDSSNNAVHPAVCLGVGDSGSGSWR